MPTFDSDLFVELDKYATTPSISNSLLRFPTGVDTRWGVLSWDEYSDGENYISVDVLKDSDSLLLAENLRWRPDGVDLSIYPNIASNDIKLIFKLHIVDKTPIFRNVRLKPKAEW